MEFKGGGHVSGNTSTRTVKDSSDRYQLAYYTVQHTNKPVLNLLATCTCTVYTESDIWVYDIAVSCYYSIQSCSMQKYMYGTLVDSMVAKSTCNSDCRLY